VLCLVSLEDKIPYCCGKHLVLRLDIYRFSDALSTFEKMHYNVDISPQDMYAVICMVHCTSHRLALIQEQPRIM